MSDSIKVDKYDEDIEPKLWEIYDLTIEDLKNIYEVLDDYEFGNPSRVANLRGRIKEILENE